MTDILSPLRNQNETSEIKIFGSLQLCESFNPPNSSIAFNVTGGISLLNGSPVVSSITDVCNILSIRFNVILNSPTLFSARLNIITMS